MPRTQQIPDENEDKAMRISCYLICAMSVAILLGLFFYTMLRRQIESLKTGLAGKLGTARCIQLTPARFSTTIRCRYTSPEADCAYRVL